MAIAGAALALTASCSSGISAQAPKPGPSAASTRLVPTPNRSRLGFDVSYPQCDAELPNKAAFGIVGLNKYIGVDFNHCFDKEMKWAKRFPGTSSLPGFSVYVHIENPGANQAKHWPDTGSTPYGTCHGKTDPACSYEYGEDLAHGDLRKLNAASAGRGLLVFEDVELGYSWQNAAHTTDNVAAMEGMATAFEQAGDSVGIYSNEPSWVSIAGTAPDSSRLIRLPVWMFGAHNMAEAHKYCTATSIAGPVVAAQLAGNSYPIDEDFPCAA